MRPTPLDEVLARVREIALALPNVVETEVGSALIVANFMVSRRRFVRLFDAGEGYHWLAVKADPLERQALVESGHPFIETRRSTTVGVALDADTDWREVEELVTESYLIVAPKKLRAEVEASLSGRGRGPE